METVFNPAATHPDYEKSIPDWELCSDCFEGSRAIKARTSRDKDDSNRNWPGTAYLPALSGQKSEKEYSAYKKRARFYGAFGRTIQATTGIVFQKKIQYDETTASNADFLDITKSGISLTELIKQTFTETLKLSRCGILVDYPKVSTPADQPLTVAAVEQMGIRPYWIFYEAPKIIYWKTGWIGNQTKLTEIRLQEDSENTRRIRRLILDETNYYKQEIYELQKNFAEKNEWKLVDIVVPMVGGNRIDFIPFVFFNALTVGWTVEKPVFLDLAELNVGHYRNSADLEHGLHYTALPTPWAAGFSTNDEGDLVIGSLTAWVSSSSQAQCGYLEFSGAGLSQILEEMQHKESQMAALGSRVLVPEKKMAESAETATLHRQGENSMLATIAHNVAECFIKLLKIHYLWKPVESTTNIEPSVKINTDYLPTNIDAGTIQAIMLAWQKGLIGHTDAIEVLKQGEIVNPSRTVEDIQGEFEVDPIRLQSIRETGASGFGF